MIFLNNPNIWYELIWSYIISNSVCDLAINYAYLYKISDTKNYLIWSYLIIIGRICPYIIPYMSSYDHIWPLMSKVTICELICSHMSVYFICNHMWLYTIIYEHKWLFFNLIRSNYWYLIIYDHIYEFFLVYI